MQHEILVMHPSRSVYYVGAEGADPALTTYLGSSTIDAIEMPDFGSIRQKPLLGFEAHRPPPALTVKVHAGFVVFSG